MMGVDARRVCVDLATDLVNYFVCRATVDCREGRLFHTDMMPSTVVMVKIFLNN
jgi:hypothetical protein